MILVIGQLVEKGDWKTRHMAIPDLKAAGQEEGEEENENEKYYVEGAGEEEQEGGREGWSPSLEPIAEEM
jgi:hypothetical protein